MSFLLNGTAASIITACLLASSAAAQPPQKTVIKNSTASASAPLNNGPYLGFVSAHLGSSSDNKPVAFVTIDVCSFQPDEAHRYCIYADGAVPVSAMSSRVGEFLIVDLADIGTLNGGVTDCSSGVCMGPLPIPRLAFRGKWTRYQGSNSFDYEHAGITTNVGRFPDNTITSVRFGTELSYSAAFQGSLGTTPLEVVGMFGTANLSSSRNMMIEFTRTAKR